MSLTRRFTIPADASAADTLAGQLGALATATEWQRAAIVSARVEVQDGPGRPTGEKAKGDRLSPEKFALLGIHGLRSKTTVRAYWRAWYHAVTEGLAQPVSLGDEVELPDAEWADYYHITPDCPPFYRPGRQAVPVSDTEVGSENGDQSVELEAGWVQEQTDDLGRGTCPPLASVLEDGDDEPINPTRHRPAQPVPQADPQGLRQLYFDRSLKATERDAGRALRNLRQSGLLDDRRGERVLELLGRIRKSLNDIEELVAARKVR